MHNSPITAIAAKENGHIITGGYDGHVICWDAECRVIWKSKLPDLINSVEISSDQSVVYVAAADGYAYALATENGFTQQRFGPHQDDVNYVTVDPNSQQILTVADAKDGHIYLWHAVTGMRERFMPAHPRGTFSAKFSPTESIYATTGGDGCVRIWKLDSSEEICVIQGGSSIEIVLWAGNGGETILTGHSDGGISEWDSASGRLLRHKAVASSTIRCLQIDKSGRMLMVGSYDGCLGLFDALTWEKTGSLQTPFQWERSGAFANEKIYVGSFSAMPIIYDLRGGIESLPTQVLPTEGINCLVESENGAVYVAGDDGRITELTERGGVVRYISSTIINAMAVLHHSRELVAADYKGALIKIDLYDNQKVVRREIGAGPINCLDYDRTRALLFSGGYDGMVRLWSPDLTEIAHYRVFDCPCKTVRIVPALAMVLVGASDGRLAALHFDGTITYSADHSLEVLNDIAVHHETARFATASRDCHVRIWDANTLRCLAILPRVHLKSIKSIAFDQKTGAIVSGSYDGTVLIWKNLSGPWEWKRVLEDGKPGISIVMGFRNGTIGAAGWNGKFHRWTVGGDPVHSTASGMGA